MEEKKITAKTVVGIVIFVALIAVLVMVVMRGIAANKALEETAESPAVTAAYADTDSGAYADSRGPAGLQAPFR